MKKLFLILVAVNTGIAYGATAGRDCSLCATYFACVIDGVSNVPPGMADETTLRTTCEDVIYNRFQEYLDDTTVSWWTTVAKGIGDDWVYDNLSLGGNMTEEHRFAYKYKVIEYCYDYGFCYCTGGDTVYLRPEGDFFDGTFGATCQTCPGGGAICSGERPLLITKCCQPAGNFSDSTGAGTNSSQCYYDGNPWD